MKKILILILLLVGSNFAISQTNSIVFKTPVVQKINTGPSYIIAADFTNNNIKSLAIANIYGVQVLLGNNSGQFTHNYQQEVFSNELYRPIAVADFHLDGHLDIAQCSIRNEILIYSGDGTAKFEKRAGFATSSTPTSIVAGNIYNNGLTHIAAVNIGKGAIAYKNFGEGKFGFDYVFDGVNGVDLKPKVTHVLLTDFNNDSRPDNLLAVSNDLYVNKTNYSRLKLSFTGNTITIKTYDLNQDGLLDIIFTNSADKNNINIFLSKVQDYELVKIPVKGKNPFYVDCGDFDLDGILDIVVGHFSESVTNRNALEILRGNGDGTFEESLVLPIDNPYAFAIADFNGDQSADIVITHPKTNEITILLNENSLVNIDELFKSSLNFQIFPNPFTTNTNITFSSEEFGTVTFQIYDVFGRKINEIQQDIFSLGDHSVQVSHNFTPGIYFCNYYFNNKLISIKKLLVK